MGTRRSRAGVAVALSLAAGLVLAETEPAAPPDPATLNEQGRYAEAETLAREQLARTESELGSDALETARVLDPLVRALWRQGKFRDPEAMTLAERAVRIKETHLGPGDPEVAKSLIDLGILNFYGGDFERAREIHARAVQILESAYGLDHPETAAGLNALAVDLSRLGRSEEALELYERVLAIRENEPGADPRHIATALLNIAQVHEQLGRYREALELSRRGSAMLEGALGPDHPVVARSYGTIARHLSALGDYRGAIENGRREVELGRKAIGERHPDFGWSLLNLGAYVRYSGSYAEALDVTERGYAIVKEALGDENVLLAYAEVQMAGVLRVLGDLDAAVEWMEKATDRRLKALGPDHPETLDAQETLADYLIIAGRREEGLALMRDALEARRRVQGEEHVLVGRMMHDLGTALAEDGDIETAAALLERSLEIRTATLGGRHHVIGDTFFRLGEVRLAGGDLERARLDLERAVAIREETLGPEHPQVADALESLARLHRTAGEPDRALAYALRAEAIGRDHLRLTARALPETVALHYAGVRSSALDLVLTLATEIGAGPRAADAWDGVIRSRAIVLDEMAARNRSIILADPEVGAIAAELVAARTRLANLTIRSLDQGDEDELGRRLEEARVERNRAERALAGRSVAFAEDRAREDLGLEAVTRSLPDGAAVVAYVRFDREAAPAPPRDANAVGDAPAPSPAPTAGPSYVAFVRPADGGSPALVDLGPATPVDDAVRAWRAAVIDVPRAELRAREKAYRALAESLRERVWDPLIPWLRSAERVLIVPDGSLHLLSFGALPTGGTRYLIESGPLLHYVSSERDVVAREATRGLGRGLLAVGGAAFDTEAPVLIAGTGPATETFRGGRSGCSAFRAQRFEPLPETKQEIDDIVGLWNDHGDDELGPAATRTGAAASEGTFKNEAPGRRVLHVATHGFFLGDECDAAEGNGPASHPVPIVGLQNPLLGSGLALAGANRRALAPPDAEDGVLTAEEIGAMELGGVEWTVLSACDTGVGEIRAGEGVLGLRRAFEVAGARTLIMSLWPVEDRSARRWMRELYRARLEDGLDTARAARAAGLAVLERQRGEGEGGHPSRWAAFVAAGAWQ